MRLDIEVTDPANLELRLGRVLAKRPHDGAQFLCRDGAVSIFVEQGEGLLELGDLLLGQLVGLQDDVSGDPFDVEKLPEPQKRI